MLLLYEYGLLLVETIDSLGEFLLNEKITVSSSFVTGLVNVLGRLGFTSAADLVYEVFSSGVSIASLIIGSGLIFIVLYRLVKFFTDIVL